MTHDTTTVSVQWFNFAGVSCTVVHQLPLTGSKVISTGIFCVLICATTPCISQATT